MSYDYNQLAEKYNVSLSTVKHLASAIALGNGQQAQFNHPELGGMGQWMPGMIMIGDAFNHTLKARVDALCHELAQAYKSGQLETTQQQTTNWWSDHLPSPTISGGQNTLKYAYFRDKDRLIISRDGQQTSYNTRPYIITGVSQQQANSQTTLIFHTQDGKTLTVKDFEKENS